MITGSALYKIQANKKTYLLVPFSKEVLSSEKIESNYYNWFHDPVVTKYNSHGLFPYTKKKREAFFQSLEDASDCIVLAILANSNSMYSKKEFIHIGNVSLQSINWTYRSAELAIIIGEWQMHGKGIGTEACKKIIEHGFKKLNMHRIWTGTACSNIPMQKTAEKCGMKHEGYFMDGMFLNGKHENIVLYSILEDEWRKNND